MRLMTLTVLVVIAMMIPSLAKANTNHTSNNKEAICKVFKSYCSQALRVTWCESRWNTWAQNGQYLGLFQMGSYARARYGHDKTALGQAKAAYRYFVASGRDWSPWSCKP